MDKELPVSVWPEWKITEKIGEGSFGKVYKARRIEYNKTFYSAIKVISIPGSQSELKSVQSESGSVQETREYFKNLMEECIQEVSTMEYFRGNSHIVAVEDYKVVEYLDTIGWDVFIRMEYLTSFLEYCSGKLLTEDEVVRLGIDLCKALQHCQMLNIIHRDIKPENIFVSRFGEFKLGDFGIARELERSMGGFSKKGTYSYMAPEMYRGENYDGRADIYSLGIMMYKLRNKNRLPFVSLDKQLITFHDKELALNKRMSGEPLPKPTEASSALSDIILRACAFKPEDRFDTAEEFRAALEDLRYTRRSPQNGRNMSPVDRPGKTPEEVRADRAVDEANAELKHEFAKTMMAESSAAERNVQKSGVRGTGIQSQGKSSRESVENRREQRGSVSERTENRRIQKQPVRERRTPTRKKCKKKWDPGTLPMAAGIGFMAVVVVILTVIFAKLLLDRRAKEQNGDDIRQVWMDESEDAELTRYLADVRVQATTIEENLNNYNWIGSEEEGKITYLDQDGKVMKILICPKLSEDDRYEEYFYWNEELFFVYVWDTEQKDINYYYYKGEKLQRWIDRKNVCHDYDRENEEFVEREKKYLKNSHEYTMSVGYVMDE